MNSPVRHELILIATSGEQGRFHTAESTIPLATISFWLEREGAKDIAFFPSDGYEADISNAAGQFECFLSAHTAPVFGISCWSNSFTSAVRYSSQIRAKYRDAIIIGGGAHFNSRDNMRKALDEDIFDMVLIGGADPFLEFMKNIREKRTSAAKTAGGIRINGIMPGSGLHWRGSSRLPHGRFSKAAVPVMFMTENGGEVTAIFSDRCGNGCEYCTVHMNNPAPQSREITENMVAESCLYLQSVNGKPVNIAIMDSSPFLDTNRKETAGTLKKISAACKNIRYTVLADPHDFDAGFEELVLRYNIATIFIGRDRISADSFIGRRLHGRLRATEELDRERETLAGFIRGMNTQPAARELYIGYIASPYETEEEADMLINEIAYFVGAAEGKTVVQPNIFILNPYRGTKVWKKAGNAAWDVAEFEYPYPNVWHGAGTRMVWLELLRLIVSPVFSTGKLPEAGLVMLRFARECEFGSGAPVKYFHSLPDAVTGVMDGIMAKISAMRPGNENSIEEWFAHIEELYWMGLLLVSAVTEPEQFAENGPERMMNHIKRSDIMITPLLNDIRLISGKKETGDGWYSRFRTPPS